MSHMVRHLPTTNRRNRVDGVMVQLSYRLGPDLLQSAQSAVAICNVPWYASRLPSLPWQFAMSPGTPPICPVCRGNLQCPLVRLLNFCPVCRGNLQCPLVRPPQCPWYAPQSARSAVAIAMALSSGTPAPICPVCRGNLQCPLVRPYGFGRICSNLPSLPWQFAMSSGTPAPICPVCRGNLQCPLVRPWYAPATINVQASLKNCHKVPNLDSVQYRV